MRRTIGIGCVVVAALGLAACGSDMGASTTKSSSDAAAVIKTFRFRPGTVNVGTGTTVTWTNRDEIEHTVTADDGTAGFEGHLDGAGTKFAHRFARPGTYAYHCAIHPGMHGRVVVAR